MRYVRFDEQNRHPSVLGSDVDLLGQATSDNHWDLVHRVTQEVEDPTFHGVLNRLAALLGPGKGRFGTFTSNVTDVLLHFTSTVQNGFHPLDVQGATQPFNSSSMTLNQSLEGINPHDRVRQVLETFRSLQEDSDRVLANVVLVTGEVGQVRHITLLTAVDNIRRSGETIFLHTLLRIQNHLSH